MRIIVGGRGVAGEGSRVSFFIQCDDLTKHSLCVVSGHVIQSRGIH